MHVLDNRLLRSDMVKTFVPFMRKKVSDSSAPAKVQTVFGVQLINDPSTERQQYFDQLQYAWNYNKAKPTRRKLVPLLLKYWKVLF
uniref:Uncharacterized protein n=1 Tax=Panagrellus redivivus TaxID=6233 RepID=A0A7E4ZVR2_PANRE